MTDAPVLARYFDTRFQLEAIKILPGQCYAAKRDVMIVTVLGSCVSACLWDASACVGGMNHFMLPGKARSPDDVGFGERPDAANSPDDVGFGGGDFESSAAPAQSGAAYPRQGRIGRCT